MVKKSILSSILVILLLPTISFSQPGVSIDSRDAGGNYNRTKVTPEGELQTNDRSNIKYWWETDVIARYPSVIFQKGQQDSTPMFETIGAREINLWLYPRCTGSTGSCDSVAFVKFGVQWRRNFLANNDSLGANPFLLAHRGTVRDTLGGHYAITSAALDTSGVVDPWTEIEVIVPVDPSLIRGGRGFSIPAYDPVTGKIFRAPYMGARVRYVAAYTASMVYIPTARSAIYLTADMEFIGW